jgi:hypothetical protein
MTWTRQKSREGADKKSLQPGLIVKETMMMNDVDDDRGDDDDDGDDDNFNAFETERQRYRLKNLEIRRRVDSNDPSLLHLKITSNITTAYFPDVGDWGEFGVSIGRNTFIEEININIYQADIRSFARGFSLNRSIKLLTLDCGMWSGFNGETLGELLPFFINNPVLKSLRVEYAYPTCLCALASSVLRQFDSLTEFTLYDYEEDIDYHQDIERDEFIEECEYFPVAVCEIFDALAGHSSLAKLRLEQNVDELGMGDDNQQWQYRQISRKGWEALTALLRKSSSNLSVLELDNTPMDDKGASILAGGLLVNASLKEFALKSTQQMTKNGWDVIFDALKRSACTLEKLSICMNQRMEDDVISSLSNALSDNCTLKSLSLRGDDEYIPSPTFVSSWDLIQLLHNPVCALERLHLTSVGLNNHAIMSLRNVIANNSRLRELQLGENHEVTTDGWVNFLTFPSNAKLEKLGLGNNYNINDEALDVFRISLTNNRTLKDLHLGNFEDVTIAGWIDFSTVLRSPNFLLEKLDLTVESYYIDVVISFADALTNNKRLRELRFFCDKEIYGPFTRVLCDNSSIMSTYNSNHILSKLSQDGYPISPLPIDLASSLQINRENGVSKAARLKIIKTHFSGSNINTKPFTVMELIVLPTAISWMGRDCGISDLMFAFVRSMPSLCNTKSRYKKRKDVN